RLINMLTVFEEPVFLTPYEQIVDTLTAYAQNDPDGPPFWITNPDYTNESFRGVFRNRHGSYFKGLPDRLGEILGPEPYTGEAWDSSVVVMLGGFGALATGQLPKLEELAEKVRRQFAPDSHFANAFDDSEISLAIRSIKEDK
ncbi:MAG: hypothetical protein Q4G59_01105, partial [Planctomycetia bacterium]|nr:hypothetical protein [Planctomycetia bacterium]